MEKFKASGVITLTTDFGHKGPFAAVMKGVIVCRFPEARIIDLAHDIPAHWPPEAGFWISRSYQYFPPGSVHLAIVDPGVGTERDIVVAQHEGHVFMAPDNGLLDPLLTVIDDPVVFRLDLALVEHLNLGTPSLTFHGRDIFAPVAAEIAAGRLTAADTGQRVMDWTPGWVDEPEVSGGRISGVVVTVDAFGNLISNIDQRLLSSMQQPTVNVAGHSFDMKLTYGRVKPGEYLALINSFGVLEIARAEGSAAAGLGSERGAPVTVTDAR